MLNDSSFASATKQNLQNKDAGVSVFNNLIFFHLNGFKTSLYREIIG